jgi:hypothetical protein
MAVLLVLDQLPGQLCVTVVANDEAAVPSCWSAVLMAGAFSLSVSAVRPLAAVSNAVNAVWILATAGCRVADADAAAASRLLLTSVIAVFSAVVPSCKGLTFVRVSSDDFSSDDAAQSAAVAGAADADGLG